MASINYDSWSGSGPAISKHPGVSLDFCNYPRQVAEGYQSGHQSRAVALLASLRSVLYQSSVELVG